MENKINIIGTFCNKCMQPYCICKMDNKIDFEKIWKRKEVDPVTGRVFWGYTDKLKTVGYWCKDQEAFDKRAQAGLDYYKTPKGKKVKSDYWERKRGKAVREINLKLAHEFPLILLHNSIRSGARKRKLQFIITVQDLNNLWIKQNGRCYYTGVELNSTWNKKHPQQVSVDRLNTKSGYTVENIVLCCQSINYAKNCYDLIVFEEFLKNITNTKVRQAIPIILKYATQKATVEYECDDEKYLVKPVVNKESITSLENELIKELGL